MQRIIILFAFVVATMAAKAFTVPFIVDDASRVEILVEDQVFSPLATGRNEIEASYVTHITVRATAGNTLVKVEEVEGDWHDERQIRENTCEITVFGDYGAVYYVTSASAADTRSAHAYLWVDAPEKVLVARGEDSEWLSLIAGNNDIPFDPERESTFRIAPADPDAPLYKVTHNSTDVTAAGTIRLAVANGDNIRIEANYPDRKHRVTLSVTGDYADDRFVSAVYVDDTFVSPDDAYAGISVQAGSKVRFVTDTRTWNVLAYTVNGTPGYYSDSYATTIIEDTDFAFTVERYTTLRVKVKVDNPDFVKVYRGLHYNNELVVLDADGCANVDVRRDTPIVTFVPAEGCYIAAASVADYVYSTEELKAPHLAVGSLNEGDVITVSAERYSRTLPAAVIISGLELADGNFAVSRSAGQTIDGLSEGFNSLFFDNWDNPHTFDCRTPADYHVYLAEQPVDETYPGSRIFEVSFTPGSVAKVFFGDAPAAGTLTLDVDPEVANLIDLTRDRITSLNGLATAPVIAGSVVAVTPKPGTPALSVKVDDADITAGPDGAFRFTTAASHRVAVTTAANAGITDIECGAPTSAELFRLNGAPAPSTPAPGLYITPSGQKIIIE